MYIWWNLRYSSVMTTTQIDINGSAVETTLGAQFTAGNGVLEVHDFDRVLATIQLTPDATEQQMHIALEEAFGLAGHFLAGVIERR